jgi:hypothetical protein
MQFDQLRRRDFITLLGTLLPRGRSRRARSIAWNFFLAFAFLPIERGARRYCRD